MKRIMSALFMAVLLFTSGQVADAGTVNGGGFRMRINDNYQRIEPKPNCVFTARDVHSKGIFTLQVASGYADKSENEISPFRNSMANTLASKYGYHTVAGGSFITASGHRGAYLVCEKPGFQNIPRQEIIFGYVWMHGKQYTAKYHHLLRDGKKSEALESIKTMDCTICQ